MLVKANQRIGGIAVIKTILEVQGMSCGMCESHVNDTIRRKFEVKKVVSSHKKGQTEIITDQPLNEDALRQAVSDTGYMVTAVHTELYVKKGLFHR